MVVMLFSYMRCCCIGVFRLFRCNWLLLFLFFVVLWYCCMVGCIVIVLSR